VKVDFDGDPAWMLAADAEALGSTGSADVVRLLPAFDHYVVAAPRDRAAVLADAVRERVYRRQGWLSPVLLAGGRMAGVWSHERKGDRIAVEIEPFGRLGRAERAAAEVEAEALARFLDGRLELRWVTPARG
jgi:hypothetical protein